MDFSKQYTEERKNLELNRALDWSTYYAEYIIAGEPLLPMTVQVWFDLLAIKSPVLHSQDPTVESVVDYLWKNSKRKTENKLLKEWRLFWLHRRILKSLNNETDALELIEALGQHIKTALDEFPSDCNNATSKKRNTMSPVSGEASMVDELAQRYSIHPDEVLQMTLRRAFSLQRVIRSATIPGYKLLEPDSLRQLKSNYLKQINEHGQD